MLANRIVPQEKMLSFKSFAKTTRLSTMIYFGRYELIKTTTYLRLILYHTVNVHNMYIFVGNSTLVFWRRLRARRLHVRRRLMPNYVILRLQLILPALAPLHRLISILISPKRIIYPHTMYSNCLLVGFIFVETGPR